MNSIELMIGADKQLHEPKVFSKKDLKLLLEIQKDRKIERCIEFIKLPRPKTNVFGSLKTTRKFSKIGIKREKLLKLIYICFRIVSRKNLTNYSLGHKTFPTAGGLNSLEIYVYFKNNKPLLKYDPYKNSLVSVDNNFEIQKLFTYTGNVTLNNASAVFLLVLDIRPLAIKYGNRGLTYGLLEAGHCAQNICLQAAHYKIGYCPIGFFDEGYFQNVIKKPYLLLEYVVAVGSVGK